jgi:hypothetical protein
LRKIEALPSRDFALLISPIDFEERFQNALFANVVKGGSRTAPMEIS